MAKFFRAHRLNKRVLKLDQPLKIKTQYFLVLYQPNQQKYPRLGIIVNTHYIKRAVDRNQFKRIIRESFRHHKENLKALDIVVIIRSEWVSENAGILRNNIDNLWNLMALSKTF